jgi:thiol-disulfide isomerase/thioredoxin
MAKSNFSFRNIPGWAVMLVVFGLLYFTGLHTEAIAQVQRLLLATGLRQTEVPEPVEKAGSEEDLVTAFPGEGFKMVDLQGESMQFEELKGKVIFLNIWATWCPPCIAEMPNIQSLYDKLGSDKIAFVMLSVDKAGLEKVKKFVERKGFIFPVYMPASPLPEVFYTQSIPTTFIISPEGKIVHKQLGMAEYDTPEVRKFLQDMAR